MAKGACQKTMAIVTILAETGRQRLQPSETRRQLQQRSGQHAGGEAQQQHALQPQSELGSTVPEPTASPAVVRIKVRRPEHKAMAMDPRSGAGPRASPAVRTKTRMV